MRWGARNDREVLMAANGSAGILLLLTVFAWPNGPAGSAKENAELVKITDQVYASISNPDGNAVGNAGILVLDRSVLVFDTHFTPEAGQALLNQVRSITPKPVRYVVNSHAHADHTHGNQVFEGAQLISSLNARNGILETDIPSLERTMGIARSQIQKLRRELDAEGNRAQAQRYREQIESRQQYLANLSRLRILAPSVTLEERLTLKEGNQEVRLLFLGEGHTNGDIVLLLPAAKIAFLGDLFFNEAIPNVQDANILNWMDTLVNVLKLEAETFVPGHGVVGDRKAVSRFLAYFQELKSLVEPAVARGDTLEQAIQAVQLPAKYSAYRFQNLFPANVQKMYAELKTLEAEAGPKGEASKTNVKGK